MRKHCQYRIQWSAFSSSGIIFIITFFVSACIRLSSLYNQRTMNKILTNVEHTQTHSNLLTSPNNDDNDKNEWKKIDCSFFSFVFFFGQITTTATHMHTFHRHTHIMVVSQLCSD